MTFCATHSRETRVHGLSLQVVALSAEGGSDRRGPAASYVCMVWERVMLGGSVGTAQHYPATGQILPVPAPAVTIDLTLLLASTVYEYGIAATLPLLRLAGVPEFTR